MAKFGICTVCQEKQALRNSSECYDELEKEGWNTQDIWREYGESASYIVLPHDSFDEPCEGSNQIPQFVCK